MGGTKWFYHMTQESTCQSSCHQWVHPSPFKFEFGGWADVVEATARSAKKHKAEQKVNNIVEWVLGGLAARTVTGVLMNYGRLCACLCVTKTRAASVSNTLRKRQEPLFHFAKLVLLLKKVFFIFPFWKIWLKACYRRHVINLVLTSFSFCQYLHLKVLKLWRCILIQEFLAHPGKIF